MNDWKKFNETLTGKEDFCSHLNIKDITDFDYTHGKRFCKDFVIKIQENIMICVFKMI